MNMNIKNAAAPPAPGGLDLLYAASRLETKLKDKESDAKGAEAMSKVPFDITHISHKHGEDEFRNDREPAKVEGGAEAPSSPHSDSDNHSDNFAIAALKNHQDKSFPQVLHEILAAPECQSIVRWLPNGFSFIIADRQRFSSEILPRYFREALLNSFIRKLNRWGFRRVKSCYREKNRHLPTAVLYATSHFCA